MYEKGRELNIGEDCTREIEADSEREAYLSYIKQIGTHDIAVLVTHSLPSGLIAKKLFDDHVDDSEVFKQKAKKEKELQDLTIQLHGMHVPGGCRRHNDMGMVGR